MSDTPAPAASPSSGGGGSKLGMAWGFAILAVLLIMSGSLGMLGQQVQSFFQSVAQGIGSFFQMLKMSITPILIVLASLWAIKALNK